MWLSGRRPIIVKGPDEDYEILEWGGHGSTTVTRAGEVIVEEIADFELLTAVIGGAFELPE